MTIYDESGVIVESPDLEKGFLRPDKRFLRHHEALPEIKQRSHYATIKTYANGGKDVEQVIDVPYRPPVAEWDEYENIMRYVRYSPEELAKRAERKAKAEREARRMDDLEAAVRSIMLTIAALKGGRANV